MKTYNVLISTDMGHMTIYDKSLMGKGGRIHEKSLPDHINNFVEKIISKKIFIAYSKELPSVRYYCLDPREQNKWSYFIDDCEIIIHYDLYEFDPKCMDLDSMVYGKPLIIDLVNHLENIKNNNNQNNQNNQNNICIIS
jgi:hypothetical protein